LSPPWKETDELGDPRKLPEREFLSVDRYNKIRWEKQSGLEIFNDVLYAEQEQNPRWDLPGKGHRYVDCGKAYVTGCDHVHKHHNGKVLRRLKKISCKRKSCPVCRHGWGSSEAERSLIRMATFLLGKQPIETLIYVFKKKFERHPKRIFHEALVVKLEAMIKEKARDRSIRFLKRRRLRAFHVILSPPQNHRWDTAAQFLSDRRAAYEIAKLHGLDAGALIPHPYRLRCKKCKSTIPDHHKTCPKCGSSEFEWYFSPHFHVIGFGWIVDTGQGYLEHGWVVKNLRDRKSIYYTFQYILSHAGVSKFHTVTWFGDLGYHSKKMLKMGGIPKVGSLRSLCPECGSYLRPLKWVGLDRPPPELEYQKGDPYKNDSWEDPSEWRCF